MSGFDDVLQFCGVFHMRKKHSAPFRLSVPGKFPFAVSALAVLPIQMSLLRVQ